MNVSHAQDSFQADKWTFEEMVKCEGNACGPEVSDDGHEYDLPLPSSVRPEEFWEGSADKEPSMESEYTNGTGENQHEEASKAQKLAWGIKDDDYMEPYKGDGYETSIPHHQNDHYDENYDHEASEEHKDYDDNWENYDYVHEASEENKDYDDSWENYDYVQEAPEEHKDYDDNWENYDYKGYEDTEEHDGYEDTMDDGFNQGPVSNIPAAFRNGSLTVPHFVHTRRVQADAEYQMKKEDMDQLGEWVPWGIGGEAFHLKPLESIKSGWMNKAILMVALHKQNRVQYLAQVVEQFAKEPGVRFHILKLRSSIQKFGDYGPYMLGYKW